MRLNLFLLIFNLLFLQKLFCEQKFQLASCIVLDENNLVSISSENIFFIDHQRINSDAFRPSPLFRIFHLKQNKNKKITAALLAFPLPFGIVGLHRIYLGCAPYVPVVYIASFGGVLGLIPLVDFCFILLDKKTEKYIDNKKVFMWAD